MSSCEKMSLHIFYPFQNQSGCFFLMSCLSSFYIINIYLIFYIWALAPYQMHDLQIFPPSGRLPFHSVGLLCCAELLSLM